ncbi:hypothetical protein [Phytoactinopolyspora endophytica]|uniref:hypothetical protein n=1 Tax=Phytoactinopolyspora endophytica TaxID=1642495 RepID=UPI00197C84CD|nr:hypothetical protein [Phytoactinopolyspora endophytica]
MVSRRTLIAGALGGAGLIGARLAGVIQTDPDIAAAAESTEGIAETAQTTAARENRSAPGAPTVLVATNEPWGTYHVRPLLDEAERRGVRLVQLVPDLSEIDPGDPVETTTLDDAPPANLLVVTGAEDWPADCAAQLDRLPVAASSLAYLNADEAPRARELRNRLRVVTSSSPAESRAFSTYLGSHRRARIVGSPQTDALPEHRPEPDTVLVLTSVTYPDETGGAAPGTELLLESAERLAAAGKHILVGMHPREDPSLWDRYEISDVPSIEASGRAEAAIGIPGTVFPLIVAAGVPVVGCVDPALTVPGYLLDVCSSTIDDAALAVDAVAGAELPDEATLYDAIGPVGGSADRLLDEWERVARPLP